MFQSGKSLYSFLLLFWLFLFFQPSREVTLEVPEGAHISLIGGNLGSRMMEYGHFETEMHLRYPEKSLFIRNMCDGGDTPGFRPHASRKNPWAFPGAERFQDECAAPSDSQGHFAHPDTWLADLKTDILIAFFGFSESFGGAERLPVWQEELEAFIRHTQSQRYNGTGPPALALISPTAYEDLTPGMDVPSGKKENEAIALYVQAMKEVAAKYKVIFVDAFSASQGWYLESDKPLTIDGMQLNDSGYSRFARFLADAVFGKMAPVADKNRALVHEMVMEKNWFWHNDYKIPNGVHAYGRRYDPFGPDNYPAEIEKIRQMTAIRDKAIWLAARKGERTDLDAADKSTRSLPEVRTNFNPEQNGNLRYLYGAEALASLRVPPGYKVELFASEVEFKDLANPVQMSFDNKGRLWVATMPGYPHYKPGDARPADKLLILEDTDQDGKADRQKVFADGLHLPVGFEFAPEGVYISQGTNLKCYTDTDGDDRADRVEVILSGFDDHDTHHNSSAFCADPSGAIYSGEGVFLHTNVETPYGTVRATNGGFYRYSPQRHKLDRIAQLSIPNPWGIAFDEWGQCFFAETSGPDVRWMNPGTVLPRYGEATHKGMQLIEKDHLVRPTSGLEFVSSRHFPEEVQGDMLINNTIGFLGTKQHRMMDKGTGYETRHRQDLLVSSDRNFRPVDMEFAPDGSLYVIDWHNILIGHMQHNARDPLRDHSHGRIYRITYPGRPLVRPASIDGAPIDTLLANLTLPEYRTRYRTRRELRGRNPEEVLRKMEEWMAALPVSHPKYEHYLLEGLWVTWGLNRVHQPLLRRLLSSKDYRVRAAAVDVLRFNGHQVRDQVPLLQAAARDSHGRVRLAAIVAASWLDRPAGNAVLEVAGREPLDEWMVHAHRTAVAHLNDRAVPKEKAPEVQETRLTGTDLALFQKGKEIYRREGYCGTCHQADGTGLAASGYPPLNGTEWVTGDEVRLLKVILKGLMGPIEVNGKAYEGLVPMTPFGGLSDEEVAAVATYVRNAFGNQAGPVSPGLVKTVRSGISKRQSFYQSEKLLKAHPLSRK